LLANWSDVPELWVVVGPKQNDQLTAANIWPWSSGPTSIAMPSFFKRSAAPDVEEDALPPISSAKMKSS
jgi:hypothetical protein